MSENSRLIYENKIKCVIICMFKLHILERLCKINSWESFIVISLTKGYKVITCWLQLHRLQTSYKLSVSARPSTSHSCRLSNVLSGSASQRSTGLTGNSQGAVVKKRRESGYELCSVLVRGRWSAERSSARGNLAVLSLKRTKEITSFQCNTVLLLYCDEGL